MAYYRFTRLQQYINGQPTDTYAKGERVDNVDYSTYETCMGGSGNSRWVSIPQTVCYNGDLWSMEKEQISYDGGVTWIDTTNTRRVSVIEPSASQCSGADNDWRVVYGEYICNGTTKCLKEAEYIGNSPTGRTRAGSIVELLSEDCGVMYQWVNVPGEYVCVFKCGRGDKYTKQKQQYSLDNGVHWEDTGETREGDFVEKNSSYCGCDTSVTRWVTVSGEYVCVGTSKYTKEKEQSSTDGTNWTDTGNTRAGSLIEASSSSCASTRWVTVSGQYSCVGTDKYNLEKEQTSTDGTNWTDTGNTRAGSTLIEANSTDCGYTPPSITRWVADTGYMCVGTDKYNKEKEQISYDSGSTWTDTGSTKAGSTLIEHDSEDCHGALLTYVWPQTQSMGVQLPYNAWVENGTELYIKVTTDEDVQRQCFPGSTSDNPVWLDDSAHWYGLTFQAGTSDYGTFTFVDSQIDDVEKSITMHHTFTPKYNGFIVVTSLGSSIPSFDDYYEANYIARVKGPVVKEYFDNGSVRDSLKVSFRLTIYYRYDVPTPITRWVADTGYFCVGFDKYNKEKEQISYTTGMSWTDTGNTKAGSTLIESDSEDCASIRWVTVSGEYSCVGIDKYNLEKEQKSMDGTNWTDTGNTRTGSTLIEANSADCGYVPHDYSTQYLTTEALGNGRISLGKESNYNSKEPITNIQYSKNNGDWTSYTYDTNISVVTGDKIRWKATIKDGNYSYSGTDYYSRFNATADYKVYGNPLSLLNNDSFIDEPDAIYEWCYCRLFYNNYKLKDASNLALPATTLADSCYISMFQQCTSLTTAPALPATTLAEACYYAIFSGCTSLTAAPVLPATTLETSCYQYMFEYCTSLNYIKCLATDISASQCTYGWTDDVSSTGTFVKNPSKTWNTGINGIPSGWTVQDA